MKKQKIIVGLASIALLAGCGVATYKKSVQIDLGSGMIREEHKSFWITIHRSPPRQTTISQALGRSIQSGRWLTVAEEGFSFPRKRIDFCYPRMLFWVGAVDRSFNNHKISATTAKMTLEELEKTTDPCVLKRHLESFWNVLGDDFDDSWADSVIESEILRIWQKTTIEQADSSNGG
ncbi:hypothetical protein JIN85_13525 [Luteolibacter pohnpeiensis]|uniref:Lipoprotein n=1 Tax=Luteolibacter pohnpeiensis TaxID=454153 RepID=A0A934S9N7_9BACT|nr:hypothetical protein [Luteolibacter pohnpeiensis]MBK1883441.1 hypothetical protein [Luteolibacter pohnpeiensis]